MSRMIAHQSEAHLRRLQHNKQTKTPRTQMLGVEMIAFFKKSVEKRQTKLGQIAICWAGLVPETLLAHSSLESYSRGTLTVLVDSAAHLYEIKQLLLAGL